MAAQYACRVSLKLDAGERVIFEGHPSWRAILAFYLKGLVVAVAAGLVVALATRIFDDDVNKGLVFLVVLVVLGLTVLIGFIKRVTTTYAITDRRLHIKRGIISREIQQTRLERVQNVNFNQTFFQRLLQVGDVDFDTAGSGDYDFSFDGVANPEEVVQKVDEAWQAGGAGTHGLGEPAPASAPTETQPTRQQAPPPQQQ
jgi:uncharacterized membrane protein YdbT with pleckstrin-like domain